MAEIVIEIEDSVLWSEVFGSAFEQYLWWKEVEFLEGNWEKPGKVRLVISGEGVEAEAVVTVDDIAMACSEVAFFNGGFDSEGIDANIADTVLQTAVLGKVVFG